MKKRSIFIMLVCVLTASIGFAQSSLMEQAREYFEPVPMGAPELKDNPLTYEKIELGKLLYFDPRLSKSGLISCNTCHNIGLGGDDDQEVSTGHGWQKGPRNAPTVFNSVFNVAQFWDGRAEDLAEQAKGPVQTSVEMNNTPERVVKTLKSIPEYVEYFKKAFPEDPDPVTFDNMADAIEAFEATLLTPDSRFDKYLKGQENALNKKEKEGLQAFINNGCAECHKGVNMGGHDYYPFGVVEMPDEEITQNDVGRFAVTDTSEDKYVFKSPSLRNIAITEPYFHSGKVWSLKEAIEIMGSAQLGIELSENDVEAILAFLKTTTGVQPKIEYPIMPPSTEDTPKPALD